MGLGQGRRLIGFPWQIITAGYFATEDFKTGPKWDKEVKMYSLSPFLFRPSADLPCIKDCLLISNGTAQQRQPSRPPLSSTPSSAPIISAKAPKSSLSPPNPVLSVSGTQKKVEVIMRTMRARVL